MDSAASASSVFKLACWISECFAQRIFPEESIETCKLSYFTSLSKILKMFISKCFSYEKLWLFLKFQLFLPPALPCPISGRPFPHRIRSPPCCCLSEPENRKMKIEYSKLIFFFLHILLYHLLQSYLNAPDPLQTVVERSLQTISVRVPQTDRRVFGAWKSMYRGFKKCIKEKSVSSIFGAPKLANFFQSS